MAVWWGAGPRGISGGGVAAGLASPVPDRGRTGQAAGLAPGSEPSDPVSSNGGIFSLNPNKISKSEHP